MLPHNESLVADPIDNTGHQDNIVLSLLLAVRIKDHFNNLFGNAKKFNALINQILFEVRNKLSDLVELPLPSVFEFLQELLCH